MSTFVDIFDGICGLAIILALSYALGTYMHRIVRMSDDIQAIRKHLEGKE